MDKYDEVMELLWLYYGVNAAGKKVSSPIEEIPVPIQLARIFDKYTVLIIEGLDKGTYKPTSADPETVRKNMVEARNHMMPYLVLDKMGDKIVEHENLGMPVFMISFVIDRIIHYKETVDSWDEDLKEIGEVDPKVLKEFEIELQKIFS